MNIRRIKLALTVGLINSGKTSNAISRVRDLLSSFKEVGAFIGEQLIDRRALNNNHIHQIYALRFEHCTVNLDLVANPDTNDQYVQRFELA